MSDIRPDPDPTRLTVDAVRHAIEEVEARFDLRLDGLREFISLHFALAESLRTELKTDAAISLAAALAAAKEQVHEQKIASDLAITKNEAAVADQLKQIGERVGVELNAIVAAAGALERRVAAGELAVGGIEKTKEGGREAVSNLQILVGLLVALIIIGGFIYGVR